MNIFKLYYTTKRIPKLMDNCIFGNSNNVFGIEINPEKYTEFIDKYFKIFSHYNIQQNIITNYKFKKVIEQGDKLGLKIINIQFTEENDISALECILNNEYKDILNIYDEGTISFDNSKNDIKKYIKDNYIIDYLCTGILK